MPRQQHVRRQLAQNFLRDKNLARRLVKLAKIDPDDVVYEIGPGRGIITAELARVAQRVIAIEIDPALVRWLHDRFRAHTNVEILGGDFIDVRVALSDYKIFANIPFNMTASIVRKILWTPPIPTEAFLIMQREPARKFGGFGGETLFSTLAKPYFEFRIAAHLERTDFAPAPNVDSVLLHISRRAECSLSKPDARLYRDFVTLGFAGWKPNLRTAYKSVLTYTQWKRLARDIGFAINVTPTQLTFVQWMRLFQSFKRLSRR